MNRKQRRQAASGRQGRGRVVADSGTKRAPKAWSLADARQLMRSGRLAEAQDICRRILSIDPENGYAHHLLGLISGQSGDLPKALAPIRKASSLLPYEPVVQLDLATVLQGLERYDEALAACRKVLRLRPDFPPAQMGLGNALRALCRYEEAESVYRKITASLPNSADAHANLGLVLKELDRVDEAVEAFERALALNPRLTDAHCALGILLWRSGKVEEALSALRRALAVKPDRFDVHAIIGRLLLEQERGIEAEAPFREFVRLCPNDSRGYEGLGKSLDLQGRHDKAETQFRRAIQLDGTRENLHRELVDSLSKQNRIEEAHAACNSAIDAGISLSSGLSMRADLYLQQGLTDLAVATAWKAWSRDAQGFAGMWLLSWANRLHKDDAIFAKLCSLAERFDEFSDEQAVSLNFILAKAYQDIGDYDRAFSFLEAGNRMKRGEFEFNIERLESSFRKIADAFDARFVARMRENGDPSEVPILIVGMPRSGTTLAEQILASHPEVHGAGELRDFSIASSCLNRPDRPPIRPSEIPTVLSAGSCGQIGQRYVERLRRRDPCAKRITDKMPFNFIRLGLVHLTLPNARIIHCVRNPVDTCLSCYQQLFKAGNRFAYDLHELGRYYSAYQKLMDHWESVLPPGRVLTLNYEELVADAETQSRRLLAHCGLHWDEACLTFHKADRQVRTASVAQVRQPIYGSSVAKWRRYERHLDTLLEALDLR